MTSADVRRARLRRRHAANGCRSALIPRNGVSRDLFGPIRQRDMVDRGCQIGIIKKEEMQMSKDGLCVVITGSASGLGAATAAILAKDGARIVDQLFVEPEGSRSRPPISAARAGAEVVVVQGDVSRDEDCKKIVAAAAPWGRLDALINNAGTTKHVAHGNLDGLSAEDFQRLFGVNTIGPFQMVRAARSAAGSRRQGLGPRVGGGQRLVGRRHQRRRLVGRLCREQGRAEHHHLSLARALAPLIRVNTVCPGYIDTPWFTKGRGEAGAKQVRDSVIAQGAAQGRLDGGRYRGSWCAFSPRRRRAT